MKTSFIFFFVLLSKIQLYLGRNSSSRPIRYLFYDVNPPEGFNLRRDVYLRMAVLASKLQRQENWVLVLPPWPHLYHWKSHIRQERLPWSHFFDLRSLQQFVPVIETLDYLDMRPEQTIEQVYILQHFDDMFETGNFEDRLKILPCKDHHEYWRKGKFYRGPFWGMSEIKALKLDCLSYHGPASFAIPFLSNLTDSSVMLDHAEVMLHDSYGDATYWKARRSMQFSKILQEIAKEFRKVHLNSTDDKDKTEMPSDWTRQKPRRSALGGPYLAVHLRRSDFVRARGGQLPSLKGAVEKIHQLLSNLSLNTVFVATDAASDEIQQLYDLCTSFGVQMVTFQPSSVQLESIKDGGEAIVEQIICSYARMFIGSYESTFSFRIQEEREIIGFPPETTFNRFCGDDQKACQQPSKWLIQF